MNDSNTDELGRGGSKSCIYVILLLHMGLLVNSVPSPLLPGGQGKPIVSVFENSGSDVTLLNQARLYVDTERPIVPTSSSRETMGFKGSPSY